MRKYLPLSIVLCVAVLTVAAGAILYHHYKPASLSLSKEQAAVAKSEAVHARGPTSAAVTLEEFGDFQCPPCGALSEPLNQLLRDYGTKVRFIFREHPLANHQYALPAALAAEAAALQGRFWEMHDLLYREQANWTKATTPGDLFVDYAKIIGLDVPKFQKDVESPETKMHVAADQKRAGELGVTVTPTIFINGKSVPSTSLNPNALRAAIDAALAETPQNG